MDFARKETIQEQAPTNSKKRNRKTFENSADTKNEPKKRVKHDATEVRRKESKVSDEAKRHEPIRPKNKQWINSMIAPIIHHQTGNPSASFLRQNIHHAILQLPLQPDVIDKDNLLSHFKTTRPFFAAHAMPLHTTPGLGPSTPDLMVRALHTKEAYQRELLSLEKKYKNASKSYPLDPADGKEVQHSVALIYATLLDRDPDPYLQPSTGYDYHFTGGTMVAIRNINGADGCTATIFKAIGASLENVEVLRVGESAQDEFHCAGDLKVHEVQSYPIDITGPILEMVPDDVGQVMLVRKQNVMLILRQADVSAGVKEWCTVQKFYSASTFASVCFVTKPAASGKTFTLCTTDYQRQLQLWIVSDDEASCEHIVKLPPATTATDINLTHRIEDNWSAVRSVDCHSLVACLDRKVIRFFTLQKNASSSFTLDADSYRLVYRGGNGFAQWISDCELCCALEVTPSEGLLFIATCHKLIVGRIETKKAPLKKKDAQILLGNDKDMIELKVLLVFAHNLYQRPVFISHQWDATIDRDVVHHFVLFSSHLPMSYGMASFTRSGPVTTPAYAARHYPYHPPTFHNTYKLAQARGFCHSAYEPLKKRFYSCQSGAVLIRGRTPRDNGEEPGLYILLQTSAGDLLQQRVSYNFERAEKIVYDREGIDAQKQTMAMVLQHWHEKLVEQAGKIPYSATSFKTMHKFRDIFNCPIEGNNLKQVLFLHPLKKKASKVATKRDSGKKPQTETDEDEGLGSSTRDDTSTCTDKTQRWAHRRREKYGHQKSVPWRQTIEELQQYRDVLAPSMLAVWGVGHDSGILGESTNLGQIPTRLPPLADINERVGSWVNGTSREQCELEVLVEENEVLDKSNSVPNGHGLDALTDDHHSQDLFSEPWTRSQAFTASQLFQQGEQPERANAKPSKRAYSKGF
ncbi:uncharacterized protein LOC128299785 [Anopheles moucheti]|uniref:uncharacterized protein LOC128299785 n=1 Tax=Anopheles moucheti TaxID=186751 RepID=UPI0022F051EE|nr:uncharacterized protein LOC128299785 [Anopheles moucheti]